MNQNIKKLKTKHTASGMLMLEAEVRLSVGQYVHSHICKKMWQAIARAFERNSGAFERSTVLRPCQELRARTQTRSERSQVRERLRIGSCAFDHKFCVRPHCRRLIFQKPEQKAKKAKN
jgi:hypothetical protein